MAGRPSKLTAERVERIREALLAGAPIAVAASRGSIGVSTYHQWEARGRAALTAADENLDDVPTADRPFADFSETVRAARHDWELGTLAQIASVGRGRPYETTITKEVLNQRTGEIVTLTETRRGVEIDWRADAWILERRNPEVYGKVWRAEVTGPEGAPIEMRVEDLVARGEAAIDELRARRDRKAG